MPKVSCIVSAYYAEQFIQGRIENLLSQKGVDFEILVSCAGGSREDEILSGFDAPNLKIRTTAGVPLLYATWNELIQEASGEYITNSNSDDRLYPGALALLAETLDSNKNVALVYANDDIVTKVDGDPVNRHTWVAGGLFELAHGCFIGPMPMWRASLHEKYGLFDAEMESSGDYEFWLRIVSNGERVMHVPQVIGAYTRRSDGIESRKSFLTTWETGRAKSRYIDWKTLYD